MSESILKYLYFLLIAAFIEIIGCATIHTSLLHDPIYPSNSDTVTLTIEAQSDEGIRKIEFYEWKSGELDEHGLSGGQEIVLGEDRFEDSAPIDSWDYSNETNTVTKQIIRGPYPGSIFVQYYIKVYAGLWGDTSSHFVGFATNPYPVGNVNEELEFLPLPIPVYVQGYQEDLFDVVFIPDKELPWNVMMTDTPTLIKSVVLAEPTLNSMRRQFNFYINPLTCGAFNCDAVAGDIDEVTYNFAAGPVTIREVAEHQTPKNWANLSTLEANAILHNDSNRKNFTSQQYNNLFAANISPEWNYTIRHELGHILGMADEYEGGSHDESVFYPNNWDTVGEAETAALNHNRDPSSFVTRIQTGWWKICLEDGCQMDDVYSLEVFDEPCIDRVLYGFTLNVLQHSSGP